MPVRLNKHLADLGIASRRKADELIAAGQVFVNSKIGNMGQQIDPEHDEIRVADAVLEQQKKQMYILLNKPTGYVTSNMATKTEPKIVLDLVDVPERIFPVGRLDKDTSGLLILTTDGVLAYRLTHPSFDCEKEYEAALDTPLTAERIHKIETGMQLNYQKTKPTEIRQLGPRRARIILREGKNRQVRRIFGKVGCEVVKLKRVRVKGLQLDEDALPVGQWRYLTAEEITMLRNV